MATLKRLLASRRKHEEELSVDWAELSKRSGASEPPKDDESNWLVSYADMMTLLCGFFIMMFSLAKLDEPSYEKVKESVAKSFGGDYKSPTKDLAKFVTQTIEEAGLEKETAIKVDSSGVAIVFRSAVFFDSLSSDVTDDGKKILEKLIVSIKERQEQELKKYRVVVEGYTDGRPVLAGVYPSNWELSGARAARVIRLFLEAGFGPERLTAIGYGDTRPEVIERATDGSWIDEALARNRRVVVRILEPKVDSIPIAEAAPQVLAPTSGETAPSPSTREPASRASSELPMKAAPENGPATKPSPPR